MALRVAVTVGPELLDNPPMLVVLIVAFAAVTVSMALVRSTRARLRCANDPTT